jgi:hypothetical protein
MSPSEYKCPLCGHGFDKSDVKCHACPMARTCSVICCPNCGYGFTGESRVAGLARRLFRFRRRSGEASGKPKNKGETQ